MLRKYADAPKDQAVVVVDEELQRIQAGTHRLGKTKLSELEPDERLRVLQSDPNRPQS